MKTIILVRHAKSSWKDPSLKDFDRPLNKRGKRDAPLMGEKLKERGVVPDLILSSPAKRAKKTARTIAEALGYPKKKIKYEDGMYHAGARYLLELVRKVHDAHTTVMLFGHNPDFNDFAEMLIEDESISNIPTTGVYCIGIDVDSWANVGKGKGKTLFFDFPKRYTDGSA